MNASGRTIKLYLADGHPAGLILAEILNWTGKVLSFPRGLLPQVIKSRPELKNTGIYFLVGSDPENSFRPIVYIGESDMVSQRLISHDRDEGKAFFEQVALIVSKDENLTKGHVRYLEARLIEIAHKQGMVQIKNGNMGQPVSLPESDQADMEYFLQQIRTILPVMGFTFLQELPKRSTPVPLASETTALTSFDDGPSFECTYLGGQIKAEAYEAEGQFILKAGSLVRNPEFAAPSLGKTYRRRVEEATQANVLQALPSQTELLELTTELPFSSPSGAADFVCGAPMNGRIQWKVKGTTQTYADWRTAQLEASQI